MTGPRTETACVYQSEGKPCGQPTGCPVGAVGVDVDLCPEHRALMAAQRVTSAALPTVDDRLKRIEEQPVITLGKQTS